MNDKTSFYDRKPINDKVPAANFVATVAVNVDNRKLTDAQFREFVRNTLPIVERPDYSWQCNECGSDEFSSSVSEYDLESLSCTGCGGVEFHKVFHKR